MEELEISRYEDMIRQLAYEKSSKIISNSDTSHAKVLIRYLLKCSKQKIRIFSTSLVKDIYDDEDVLKEFEEFVNEKEGKVDIILQNPEELTFNRSIVSLIGRYPDQFSIRTVGGKYRFFEPHFVVNDTHGYRFCPDKSKRSAIAAFNLKKTADNLIEQFKVLFKMSDSYNVGDIGLQLDNESINQKQPKEAAAGV